MKRYALLVMFLSSIQFLFAANGNEFDRIVDFNMNVQQIDTLVSQSKQAQIDPKKYLLLNGTVASIDIIRPGEKDFLALVELVTGNWVGLEKVNLYRVYLVLSGPEYFKRLPARPPRNPPFNLIQVNDRLIVVGTYADVAQAPDGKPVAVIRAVHVRHIQ